MTEGAHAERVARRGLTRDHGRTLSGFFDGRSAARAWVLTIPEQKRLPAARSFIRAAIGAYIGEQRGPARAAPRIFETGYILDGPVADLAALMGKEAAQLPIDQACYRLSATYTALVPNGMRSAMGMYYTPPALTNRLLDLAEEAGVDWQAARVLDPACGGGAFLLPVALRMKEALRDLPPKQRVSHFAERLRGFEIDAFAAWLTQVWLQIALADILEQARAPMPSVVQICDTLQQSPKDVQYDLVIGNPPYGRVSLRADQRQLFKRSLYGHANLYGVFTDVAMRWTKSHGVIAYVTPTSFLAGEYFKALRHLLATESPPIAIDFVQARRGVFEDVLQETLLATYRKGGTLNHAAVHYLDIATDTSARVTQAGQLVLPDNTSAPWFAPRSPSHQALVRALIGLPHRLSDWGYRVSTGPLVWNRFKAQLRSRPGKGTFPLVWAEAVTADGRFLYRAEKRGHLPYFRVETGDEWLKVSVPCVLVQRTTAKEQVRRLIAAEMPAKFVRRHGGVVVENHLNMVRPDGDAPKVSPAAVAALLNSTIADEAFRCISGSVAVSAFELEALPVPTVTEMKAIEWLIARGARPEKIDQAIRVLYLGKG